jgi:2-hydroxychromene-2-carboxylate isomerase
MQAQPVFYYDIGHPECYLAAEVVMSRLPVAPEWEPVLWTPDGQPDRGAIAARAAALSLQALRWPVIWPPESLTAMLAATYAKGIGRGVAFSLAAFRQAFAGGRDLGESSTSMIAGAACEIHPKAILKAIRQRSVIDALDAATDRAYAAGVTVLPAVTVEGTVFDGELALDRAAAALGGAP